MFVGSLRQLKQQCPSGYVYDAGIQDCVSTWETTVTDCADPNKVWNELTQQCEYSGSGGATSGNMMLYLGLGAVALLLLSFMGGRASKKSGSRLVSRTSTRSVFA